MKIKTAKHKWKRLKGTQYITRFICENCDVVREKNGNVSTYHFCGITTNTEPFCNNINHIKR